MINAMMSEKLKIKNLIDKDSSYFEEGNIGSWTSPTGITITLFEPYLGRNCVKFNAGNTSSHAQAFITLTSLVEAGETYRIKYKYASANRGLQIRSGSNNSNPWYTTIAVATPTFTSVATWQNYEVEFVASDYTYLLFEGNWDIAGYFDDIELIKV